MTRFATLLELHRRREDEARKRLGLAQRRREELRTRRSELAASRDVACPDLALREVYIRHWHRIGEEILAVDRAAVACDQEIDTARQALVAAHRDASTFAKLVERDRLRAVADRERRRTRAIDDLAAAKAARERGL